MNKELLKNSWVLVGILTAITVIIGLIMGVLSEFFKIKIPSVFMVFMTIYGAMIIGQTYTRNFKEIMPKKLRINVTIIYSTIQLVLGLLYIFVLTHTSMWGNQEALLISGIVIGIMLIVSLFIYFMLGYGGKTYFKALRKR